MLLQLLDSPFSRPQPSPNPLEHLFRLRFLQCSPPPFPSKRSGNIHEYISPLYITLIIYTKEKSSPLSIVRLCRPFPYLYTYTYTHVRIPAKNKSYIRVKFYPNYPSSTYPGTCLVPLSPHFTSNQFSLPPPHYSVYSVHRYGVTLHTYMGQWRNFLLPTY